MTVSTDNLDRALHSAGSDRNASDRRVNIEFRRARRHSRLVSALKIGLPLAAVLIVAGGAAVTWLARSLPGEVGIGGASIEDGRIVMQDPRMSGYDKNDRPYSMIAQRALQSLSGGGVDLEGVRAHVTIGADATAEVAAAKGHYEQTEQTLRLFQDINVDTSDGMSIKMSEANIDFGAGSMIGSGPIAITTASQTISAGALSVADGGRRLSFSGGVKMTVMAGPAGLPTVSDPAIQTGAADNPGPAVDVH